jgi:hypothetical protein
MTAFRSRIVSDVDYAMVSQNPDVQVSCYSGNVAGITRAQKGDGLVSLGL